MTVKKVYEYNNINPLDRDARRAAIGALFGSAGENCVVEQPLFCTYGYNTTVGDNFFLNVGCKLMDSGKITIGNKVFIAPNVCIITEEHAMDVMQRLAGLEYTHPVVIGDNVWICAGALILPGVTIGAGSVIGAGERCDKGCSAGVFGGGESVSGDTTIVMKDYTVVLYSDRDTENRFSKIINAITDGGGNCYLVEAGIPPHLTVAMFRAEEVSGIIELLDGVSFSSGEVFFSALGEFAPWVLYAASSMCGYLLDVCRRANELIRDAAELGVVREIAARGFAPFSGQCERVALAECNPYKELRMWRVKS